MEIKFSSSKILKVLLVLSYIVFVGVLVNAGTYIVTTVLPFVVSEATIPKLWDASGLYELFKVNKNYFLVLSVFLVIIGVLKAVMFYLTVDLLQNKKLDLSQPFNAAVGKFMFNLSYLSLAIGLFSYWASEYKQCVVSQGFLLPANDHFGGADVWLFMGLILYVVAHIFKRGIEIQSENELTV